MTFPMIKGKTSWTTVIDEGLETLSPSVGEAVEQVLALRKLTRDNQTITTRSQNHVLQRLSPQDTIAVAVILEKHERLFGW